MTMWQYINNNVMSKKMESNEENFCFVSSSVTATRIPLINRVYNINNKEVGAE